MKLPEVVFRSHWPPAGPDQTRGAAEPATTRFMKVALPEAARLMEKVWRVVPVAAGSTGTTVLLEADRVEVPSTSG